MKIKILILLIALTSCFLNLTKDIQAATYEEIDQIEMRNYENYIHELQEMIDTGNLTFAQGEKLRLDYYNAMAGRMESRWAEIRKHGDN